MTGLPRSAEDSPVPAPGASARSGRIRTLWKVARTFWSPDAAGRRRRDVELARILDLFEEYVYAGSVTPDGRYVHHASMSSAEGLIGGSTPADVEAGGGLGGRPAAPGRGPKRAGYTPPLFAARAPGGVSRG